MLRTLQRVTVTGTSVDAFAGSDTERARIVPPEPAVTPTMTPACDTVKYVAPVDSQVTDWETVAPGVGVTVAAAVTLEPAGMLIGTGVTVTAATFVTTVIVAVPRTLALAVDVAVIGGVPGGRPGTVPLGKPH